MNEAERDEAQEFEALSGPFEMSEHIILPESRTYGLELQEPFSEALISGRKTIETRLYSLPEALLYKHVVVIESGKGQDGRSGLGDSVALKNDGSYPRCIGSVVFSECFEYTSEEQWRADANEHLVPPGSAYDWPSTPPPVPPVIEEEEELEEEALVVEEEAVVVEEKSMTPKEVVSSGHVWLAAGDKEFKPHIYQKRRKKALAAAPDMSKKQAPPKRQPAPAPAVAVEAAPRKRIYGWRVLGAFRAHIEVQSILRVHRSIFDCGEVELPLSD